MANFKVISTRSSTINRNIFSVLKITEAVDNLPTECEDKNQCDACKELETMVASNLLNGKVSVDWSVVYKHSSLTLLVDF